MSVDNEQTESMLASIVNHQLSVQAEVFQQGSYAFHSTRQTSYDFLPHGEFNLTRRYYYDEGFNQQYWGVEYFAETIGGHSHEPSLWGTKFLRHRCQVPWSNQSLDWYSPTTRAGTDTSLSVSLTYGWPQSAWNFPTEKTSLDYSGNLGSDFVYWDVTYQPLYSSSLDTHVTKPGIDLTAPLTDDYVLIETHIDIEFAKFDPELREWYNETSFFRIIKDYTFNN